jgi:glutamine synthetase
MTIGVAEYIWIDGTEPTKKLRSKWRTVNTDETFPDWGFDGSSTNQSPGHASDLPLKPIRTYPDPVRGPGNYLVLCEVPGHKTNTRARLRRVLDDGAAVQEPWFGFEQEYTLFKGRVPLGWPRDRGVMPPQGPYYCGVGADEVFGRELVEDHRKACLEAGLLYYGGNAEVMPGQWEFQVGYRGLKGDPSADPLRVADDLIVARWLLYRLGENLGISASISAKPVEGQWNGAGMHTNFSTKEMRNSNGIEAINRAINNLANRHQEHIAVYGVGNDSRLTGEYETCHIDTFKFGEANRGASIRIPAAVSEKGRGYLEDRRPAANACPYEVASILLETICGKGHE